MATTTITTTTTTTAAASSYNSSSIRCCHRSRQICSTCIEPSPSADSNTTTSIASLCVQPVVCRVGRIHLQQHVFEVINLPIEIDVFKPQLRELAVVDVRSPDHARAAS
jgi:hypothetical protein